MKKFEVLSFEEQVMTEDGFIPLVILGVAYTASQVAAASGACFLAGFAGGIAIGSIEN